MHAIVSTVSVDNVEEARSLLPVAREALVSRAPGIVCAYWLEPIDGIGMSVLVFESREFADAAASYPVPPMPGVKLLTLEIREVFAHV
jgi:hypothetical protein